MVFLKKTITLKTICHKNGGCQVTSSKAHPRLSQRHANGLYPSGRSPSLHVPGSLGMRRIVQAGFGHLSG